MPMARMPRMLSAGMGAVMAACLLVTGAQAQDGLVWQSGSYNDESDGGRLRAFLSYSKPETDNEAFSAFCVANSGVGTATIAFGANTGELPPGSPLSARFSGRGIDQTYPARVSHPQGGEGTGGIAIDVSNHDPLWQALASLSEISVTSPNGSGILPLNGSSGPVRQFIEMCRSFEGIGQGTVQAAQQPPQQAALDPRWQTCETFADRRSQESGTAVTVTFRNTSDGYRGVMWVGFDGVPVNYANLNPGEEYTVSTFLTHPWMFTDGPGNCIEMFMPQLGVDRFNISAPGRDFGPE